MSSPMTACNRDGSFIRESPRLGYYDGFFVIDYNDNVFQSRILWEKKAGPFAFLLGKGASKVCFRLVPASIDLNDAIEAARKFERDEHRAMTLRRLRLEDIHDGVVPTLTKVLRPDLIQR